MELHDRRSLFRRLADDPVAAAAAALLGAGVAGLLIYAFLQIRAAGDEPPVRVRHGTVILEVVHGRHSWRAAGGKWILTGGVRASDTLQLYLAPTDPAHCGNVQKGSTDVMRLIVSNDSSRWIEVKSVGRHLEVTAANGMTGTITNGRKWLNFGSADDFISSVTLGVTTGGSSTCTFAQKDAGLHILITE